MGSRLERVKTMNPLVDRENYDKGTIQVYRTVTITTWLLEVILGLIYTIDDPAGARTIQAQNAAHPTPFALEPQLLGFYWAVLLLSQLTYIYHLFHSDSELLVCAANLGSHFIINNLLTAAFTLCWVNSLFWVGEVFLVLNFFNLKSLYLKHSRMPPFSHYSIVVGPKMWIAIALFTNGAAAVDSSTFAARIAANVFIWAFLPYGIFFIAVYRDHVVGILLPYLMAVLAIQQYTIGAYSLQTIFAITIAAALGASTLLLLLSRSVGSGFGGRSLDTESGERRPLLDDE